MQQVIDRNAPGYHLLKPEVDSQVRAQIPALDFIRIRIFVGAVFLSLAASTVIVVFTSHYLNKKSGTPASPPVPSVPHVNTPCGEVSGTTENLPFNMAPVWRYSLPYGAAPVGDLRWRPPVPSTCAWEGIYNVSIIPTY